MAILQFLQSHREITFPIVRLLLISSVKVGNIITPRAWYPKPAVLLSLWLLKKQSKVFNLIRSLCEKILNPNHKPLFIVTHFPPPTE
jgi:hypothetical protein